MGHDDYCDMLDGGVSCLPIEPDCFDPIGCTFVVPGDSGSAWEIVERAADGLLVLRSGTRRVTMSAASIAQKLLSGELVRCDAREVL